MIGWRNAIRLIPTGSGNRSVGRENNAAVPGLQSVQASTYAGDVCVSCICYGQESIFALCGTWLNQVISRVLGKEMAASRPFSGARIYTSRNAVRVCYLYQLRIYRVLQCSRIGGCGRSKNSKTGGAAWLIYTQSELLIQNRLATKLALDLGRHFSRGTIPCGA
jgi:hypothetical protein